MAGLAPSGVSSQPLCLGVLASGRGSNFLTLAKACREENFPARIGILIYDQEGAGVKNHARDMGIDAHYHPRAAFETQQAFEAAMSEKLSTAGVELVCLAGFMRILSASFVTRWYNRLINIHPSLLPSFKGLKTHARALEAGVRLHGATVHAVRPAMDEGPILMQAAIPVLPEDSVESLEKRVLGVEHILYPTVVRYIAEGRLQLVGEKIITSKDLVSLSLPGYFWPR
jgi:phosphoribosylglycinamide formyltransferase 1